MRLQQPMVFISFSSCSSSPPFLSRLPRRSGPRTPSHLDSASQLGRRGRGCYCGSTSFSTKLKNENQSHILRVEEILLNVLVWISMCMNCPAQFNELLESQEQITMPTCIWARAIGRRVVMRMMELVWTRSWCPVGNETWEEIANEINEISIA